MSFSAEHKGFVEKRYWYKVRWIKQPAGEEKNIVGKVDLLIDRQYEKHKNCLEVIKKIKTQLCTAGLSVGFGSSKETEIDKWIAENAEA